MAWGTRASQQSQGGESLSWLQDNATLLSAGATMITALVWVLYAHVAITTYIRHRRPRVIIDQTEEESLETKFLIVNLSEQAVYINYIIVVINYNGRERAKRIRTYFHISPEEVHQEPRKAQTQLGAGTLHPGDLFLLGDTDVLLAWMMEEDEEDQETPHAEKLRRAISRLDTIEIRVIVTVGVEDKPVGSSRLFDVEKVDATVLIHPRFAQTRHLTSRRERRTVEEWRQQALEA